MRLPVHGKTIRSILTQCASLGTEKLSYLIDTNILVDALRLKNEAVSFLKTLGEGNSIAAVTVTELFAGLRSEKQANNLNTLLDALVIRDFSRRHAELAGDYIRKYGKSHSVAFADAAIAATAQVDGLRLITLNTKHFPMFPGLKKPY